MNKTLLLIICAAAILMTACGGDTQPATQATAVPTSAAAAASPAGPVPVRPVILMNVLGEAYDGLLGAYCWLQAANDIRCEPDPLDMMPDNTVPVLSGDVLSFAIQGDAGPPSAFYATLIDDRDADGDPVMIDFDSPDDATYTVDLDPGTHRLNVVAEYEEVGGDNTFVTTIFSIDVATSVAAVPTPRPSATGRPTTAPTTDETKPTDAPAQITTAATEAMTEEIEATTEVAVTDMATRVAPTSLPTTMPTIQPTSVPTTLPAQSPPPSPIPPATTAPASGGELAASPPEVLVINGGRQFLPSATRFCYRDAGGREVCVDAPASADSERVLVGNNSTIRIDSAGDGPLSMVFILGSSDQSEEFQRVEMPGSNVALFTISGEPGNYTLTIDTVWPEGTATYYFRLQIVG